MNSKHSSTTTTQFWMFPSESHDWKQIPLVPFESYQEYETCLEFLSQRYADMVVKVLVDIIHHNTSIDGNATLRPWSIKCFGFPRNVRSHWIHEGEILLLEFTKGLGDEWCNVVSVHVSQTLNTAIKTFVKHSPAFQTITPFGTHIEEYKSDIFRFLHEEVTDYIKEGALNPFDRTYTFERVNFTYYNESCWMMPIGQFQAIMLAFAMGTHNNCNEDEDEPEPTSNCLVRLLPFDLLQIIFRRDIFI
jgi:hypothetical protein